LPSNRILAYSTKIVLFSFIAQFSEYGMKKGKKSNFAE